MSINPPAASPDVLPYQATPAARAEAGTLLPVLAGSLALLFATVVVVATILEERRVRYWEGQEVYGLWACLLLAVALTPVGLLLGGRLLVRRSPHRRRAWLALALSGAGAALLVCFLLIANGAI